VEVPTTVAMTDEPNDKEVEDASLLLSDTSILLESSLVCSLSPEPPSLDPCWASFLRRAKDEDIKNILIADNIHGMIEVPAVCQAIIDTEQFDRLRGIRQLGCAHYVYPASKHSRWEHSLGVMHLAGQFVDHLMKKQPGCADSTDRLCVMLAGLCHDLGHGPFSHTWEAFVNEAGQWKEEWRHEKTSLEMFDWVIEENNLKNVFLSHGIGDKDLTFVKEIIYGQLHFGGEGWPFVGRGPEKYFLYEIVANKISSIDVDKWDYMLRDNSVLKIGLNFDYKRFIMHSDIMVIDGRTRLCIRKKEAENVQDMFLDRARLHRKGYQHRTIKIIDRMMVDALLAANNHHPLVEEYGLSLSNSWRNIKYYSKLSDDFLIRSIQFSNDKNLLHSKQIILKIFRRQLYKLVGSVEYCGQLGVKPSEAEKELNALLKGTPLSLLEEGDMAVIKKKVDLGMGSTNPVENVLFVDKLGRATGFNSDQMRQVMPQEILSEALHVVCRRENVLVVREAKELFRKWAKLTFKARTGISVRLHD